MEITRATRMEVSKDLFISNIEKIKNYAGGKAVMPIIKANAYGTYLNYELDILNMFDIVAVAIADEAVAVRSTGYQKDILILNQPYYEDLEKIIRSNVIIGLSSIECLDYIISNNLSVRCHLEIETGMNRTGINLLELDSFIKKIKEYGNIKVEGIYTHFSSADFDEEYTRKQIELFKEATSKVKSEFDTIKYVHSEASNGIINFDSDDTNLIRPGIIMYGYESFRGSNDFIDVTPIAKLVSRIVFLKEIDVGESVSYSRHFIAKEKTKVATIPIGYADGLRRALSENGEVVINGKKAPIIGSVCMDSIMVDVTNIDAKVNDKVYIWDNDIITLDEIAKKCNTINYEIISGISSRVPREFV